MKPLFPFLAFFLLFSVCATAQIRFSKGYYIDNQDQKTPCYIKNSDWEYNPESFQYKLDSLGERQEQSLATVKEFGVEDLVYKRSIVRIDKSKMESTEISNGDKPEWVQDTVFLKVLSEGSANLFSYTDKETYRFFFSTDSIPLQQLVYKKYYRDNKVKENVQFRQQLLTSMRCGKVAPKEDIHYSSDDLIPFFEKYNVCKGGNLVQRQRRKEVLHLKVFGGINHSSLSTQIYRDAYLYGSDGSYKLVEVATHFKSKNNFMAGLEMELVLPFHKNKWSIVGGASYQHYSSESEEIYVPGYEELMHFDYNAIDVPLGFRYSMFLSKKSKLYINPCFLFYFPINVEYAGMKAIPGINAYLALGYAYGRWSLEGRYHIPRNLYYNHAYDKATFNTASLLLGFRLF